MYYQSSKFDLFRHFWPQVTFITSWHLSSESLRQERHFYTPWIHFQWLLKFDLFSEFLTSGDLCWPCGPFVWKADVKSVILIYHLPTFNGFEIWPIFGILTLGDLCWPWVTFVDLVTPFLWKAVVQSVILIYNLATFNDF